MKGIEFVEGGNATTPEGFLAGAVAVGIKPTAGARLDLGILASDRPATVAAMFTRSSVRGAPVLVSQKHASNGRARGVVVNSGISNVATGGEGIRNAEEMCA